MNLRATFRRLLNINTIYGVDQEHDTPYMTRMRWFGQRLRLHIFHRGDQDRDPHDHPFAFVTFPLRSYVERVYTVTEGGEVSSRLQVVKAFRFHHRPATHLHCVLGKHTGFAWDLDVAGIPSLPTWAPVGKFVTIVFTSGDERPWRFLKDRDGRWCWIGWREYIWQGGKHAPCEPSETIKGTNHERH